MSLNDRLKDGAIDFEILSIGSLREFPKKAGGSYEAHATELKVRATGEVIEQKFFPNQITSLGMKEGGLVRGTHGDQYPEWGNVSGDDAPAESNHTQVKAEQSFRDKQDATQTSIVLQAFTKSWIESGVAKTPEEACDLAKQTYFIHKMDVLFIINDND